MALLLLNSLRNLIIHDHVILTDGKALYSEGFTQWCDYFEVTNWMLIGPGTIFLVGEIGYQSSKKGHLPTAIMCHHYNVTIKGSMCVQVGDPPT